MADGRRFEKSPYPSKGLTDRHELLRDDEHTPSEPDLPF